MELLRTKFCTAIVVFDVFAVMALCACGPDVIAAAGTSATAAANAAQQGKQEKEMADAKIKAMQEASQKHVEALEQADKATQ